MSEIKESEFAIPPGGKENIRDRIKLLFRDRSLRKVAADWNLPYSTLNNYFARSALPSIEVLLTISEIEGVSLEWLATGKEATQPFNNETKSNSIETIRDVNALRATWLMLFDTQEEGDMRALLTLLLRRGVRGVLEIADSEMSTDNALLRLDNEEKERLLALHEAKKGASEECKLTEQHGPDSEHKRAG